MRASRRSLEVMVLAALLAGCGVAPTAQVTATPTGTPTAGTVSPGPATAAASATPLAPSFSASAVPTPSPTRTSQASPPPLSTGGFTTPTPADPAAAWTGIRWTKVAATDPLAHVRSVTRWAGGFVATGDLVTTGTSARTKMWVSADGGTWELLRADVFGPTSVVVGVGAIAGGVVALTVQSGTNLYADEASRSPSDLSSWTLEGPWQSWTSTDGRSWTAHPGPGFTVPRNMTGYAYPTLLAGAGDGPLALTLDNQPLAFTRDGIAWETASLDAFPGGPAGWKAASIVAFPPGFVAVGDTPTGSVALASVVGRTWTSSALPAACPAGDLTAGPAGLILAGSEGDPHGPTEVWCSSLDGRSWQRLSGYPPLGVATVGSCRGVCADGILLGNGERMVAYRGDPDQAGWTSFDGRSWTPLALSGSRPTGLSELFGYPFGEILTPIGLLFLDTDDGSAWLGTPKT
jgi:hypothetical protein